MYPAAERRQQAYPPVAELVETALEHQRPVVRDGARRCLIVQIAEEVLGRSRFEIVVVDEALDGSGPRVDVLITKLISAETRWYFDQNDGRLVGFDTYLDEDADPCEVRITEYGALDGSTLPKSFTVRSAGVDFATFNVTTAELQPAEE